jgi:hypothetical protein
LTETRFEWRCASSSGDSNTCDANQQQQQQDKQHSTVVIYAPTSLAGAVAAEVWQDKG